MTHLALIGISLILGLVHGGAFGAPGAALSQFFAAALFATLVFLMQRHSRRAWVLAIAVFWLASYTVGLRWLAFGLMSAHALGTLLGALVYALAVIGLSSTSIVSMTLGWFVFARLKMPVLGCATISACFILGDSVREWLLPGFPWLSLAYAHIDSPFATLLPFLGAEATSIVVLFTALLTGAVFADAIARHTVGVATAMTLAALTCSVGLLYTLSPGFTQPAPAMKVAVMQSAVSTKEKFTGSLLARHLGDIVDFAESHDARLILTPETALPSTLDALTSVQRAFLERPITPSRALLLGAFAQDSAGHIYNSALLFQQPADLSQLMQRSLYVKRHLAPVGEYAPVGFHWLADLLALPVSDVQATGDSRQNFQIDGLTVVPSVCLDLLYGEDFRTDLQTPHLLVNLSNPAFSSSPAVHDQFVAIARARALEEQTPLLVSANYGPSVFVDAEGQVRATVPSGATGGFEVDVATRIGATPYGRFGEMPLQVFIGLVLVAASGTLGARALRFNGGWRGLVGAARVNS